MLTRQHTHAPKKALPESTGCRVTKLAIRMSEHSIIKFHVCSKQVQKDSSPDAEEEQASSLREDRQTNAENPIRAAHDSCGQVPRVGRARRFLESRIGTLSVLAV